jgi:hypothetical protein
MKKPTKNLECHFIKTIYDPDQDLIQIQHFEDDNKNLLSVCTFEIDDAYSFAKHVIEVADEALGVQ